MAEGVPRDTLFEVWRQFERADGSEHVLRAAPDPEQLPAVQAAAN
jgi:hypothetical protein